MELIGVGEKFEVEGMPLKGGEWEYYKKQRKRQYSQLRKDLGKTFFRGEFVGKKGVDFQRQNWEQSPMGDKEKDVKKKYKTQRGEKEKPYAGTLQGGGKKGKGGGGEKK